MAGRTISKELKAQIVSAYRQGEKMKDIAELYGVSYPTVSKLVRASVNSSVSLVGIKRRVLSVVKINTKWVHIIAHIVEQTL